ncbi:MAG: transglycosylase SLT domain-containing protein [Parvibaculaceae bacterium]
MTLVSAIIAPSHITAALQQASAKTGTDFNYLLKTAMRESSLNCNAKSGTSSACGLFQFTEQTWLGTMKKDGPALGLSDQANAISKDSNGRYVVTDPAARREILALRNNPEVSALMAGALTNESRESLEGSLGRSVNGGELYIAHFLGAGGATKLISSAEETPNVSAATLFPQAAAANRSIFYNKDGSARSASEVYNNLIAKHRDVAGGTTEVASSTQTTRGAKSQSLGQLPADFQNFSAAIADNEDASVSVYSAPSSGRAGLASVSGFGGRSSMTMTPDVVQILSSLNVPDTSKASDLQAANDKRDERKEQMADTSESRDDDRREVPAMTPRGSRYFG